MDSFKITMMVVVIGILAIAALTMLTSRGFSKSMELIHKDTDKFHKGYNFSDPLLTQYQTNGIVFTPYTRQNPEHSYQEKFPTYSLRLAAYKEKENGSKAVINYVTIEAAKDVRFNKLTKDINKKLEFGTVRKNKHIQCSEVILVDGINHYDMELNQDSRIKVMINVTVEESGKSSTCDLEYYFDVRTRRFLVQR
ncbi:MAG: hypothetical protein ACOYVK_07310 [Bacillota bacterium]